ncbi:MAG: AraC family transcriptional regulator [Eubacteriales bacterium]|nr:AraC family transcriptional regulator [Eubacteriales bacterium]
MIYSYRHSGKYSQRLPLLVSLIGIDHEQEPVHRPKGMQLFQFFYCISGKGEVIIDGKRSVLLPGQGFILYPEVSHSYRPLTEDWKVDFIGFQGYSCASLLSNLGMHISGLYQISGDNLLRKYLLNILDQPSDQPLRQRERTFSVLCYDFLLNLSDHIRFLTDDTLVIGNDIVRSILSFLEEHYAESFSIDDIAESLQLSRGYIQTLFKREMHCTIWQQVLRIRLGRARFLLIQNPGKKIAEIASECGFESPGYFGMLFKKETGKTPEQYRREL